MHFTHHAAEHMSFSKPSARTIFNDTRKKFFCPEESRRYSGALEQLVFNKLQDNHKTSKIVEFGSGTGEPVISALMNSNYLGAVYGYEINRNAVETATSLIDEFGLSRQYTVQLKSFFDADDVADAEYLIANPPYLPALDRSALTLPDLCGGEDGIDISKALLSTGHLNVLLLVSSYSNPKELLRHASSLGYKITDFQITKMSFGVYSKQDVVQRRIHDMKVEGKAFFTDNCYLVGGAFFTKEGLEDTDLSAEFESCLTALGRQ